MKSDNFDHRSLKSYFEEKRVRLSPNTGGGGETHGIRYFYQCDCAAP